MKRYRTALVFIATGILISSAATAQKHVFRVNVNWPGGDGKEVAILADPQDGGGNGLLDSAVVSNATAVLEVPFNEMRKMYVQVNKQYLKPVLLQDGTITLSVSNNSTFLGSAAVVNGDVDQEIYQQYENIFATGFELNMKRSREIKPVMKDTAKVNAIISAYKPAFDSLLHVQDDIAMRYPNRDISAYLLSLRLRSLPKEEIDREFNALSRSVRKGKYGKKVQELVKIKTQREIGQDAFHFTAYTKDKKAVKLSDYKGQYVLLDFWSSYCAPCLRMAPKVKELYTAYHEKGLEIISVSLDTQRDAWVNAMEKHALSGVQVSSLKGQYDPVAAYYGIEQMPAMILIDREGKNAGIVVPEKLDEKLAELFGKH